MMIIMVVDAAGHIRARRARAWVRGCVQATLRRSGSPAWGPLPTHPPSPSIAQPCPHALSRPHSLPSPSHFSPSSPHLTSHLTLSRNAAHAQCKPPAIPTPQHAPRTPQPHPLSPAMPCVSTRLIKAPSVLSAAPWSRGPSSLISARVCVCVHPTPPGPHANRLLRPCHRPLSSAVHAIEVIAGYRLFCLLLSFLSFLLPLLLPTRPVHDADTDTDTNHDHDTHTPSQPNPSSTQHHTT
jgi:hypothetical protein